MNIEDDDEIKTDKHGFVRIEITPEMVKNAERKAKEMGALKNSIRSGKGNLVAFLGEEIARQVLRATSKNTYQHDLEKDGLKIEVKTKDRTVDPLPHHNATVAKFNTKQAADFYCFVSVRRDKETDKYTHGHLVGLISKENFFEKARFFNEGDLEPGSNPPFYFRADCFNIHYSELSRFEP